MSFVRLLKDLASMASYGSKQRTTAINPNETDKSEYTIKLPSDLIPTVPDLEQAAQQFKAQIDPNMSGQAFIDQYVNYKVQGLPEAIKKDVMDHRVNDKYLTLAASSLAKPSKITGPKRTKQHKLMSSRQRKANKLHLLTPECEKYELYVPLHELWKQYMKDTLKQSSTVDRKAKVAKSDWHGSIIQVIKSCNPGLVGVNGIILQETTNTFKIITKDDKYKTLPKANNVFTIQVEENQVATIYGNHILYKTSDRSVRKFKSKLTLDIGV